MGLIAGPIHVAHVAAVEVRRTFHTTNRVFGLHERGDDGGDIAEMVADRRHAAKEIAGEIAISS